MQQYTCSITLHSTNVNVIIGSQGYIKYNCENKDDQVANKCGQDTFPVLYPKLKEEKTMKEK